MDHRAINMLEWERVVWIVVRESPPQINDTPISADDISQALPNIQTELM